MKFFSKKKKSSPAAAQDGGVGADVKTKKKKTTPLKKLAKLWKKRSPGQEKKRYVETPPQKKKKPSKLTLVSPETGGDINNFYSNDTDGFEVILDGEQLQYEENTRISPEKDTHIEDCRNCGAIQACSPLSDWNNFVSLLVAPNLDEIQKFVFGDTIASYALTDSKSVEQSPGVRRVGSQNGRSRTIYDSGGSIPFDEEPASRSYDNTIRRRAFYQEEEEQEQEQETIEIRHFSSISSSKVRSPIKRPIGSGGPLTPPKLTEQAPRSLNPISAMLRKTNLPDEEVYDTEFTLQFLKEVSKVGIIMTYFKVPNDDQEIISHVVSLKVQPGLARGSRLLEPKLCWTQINEMDIDGTNGTSISLLGIHSIHTSLGGNEEDETPFFTITTENGEVHAFESPTLAERNYIVHGIKNVVAWLSYHLVMGNMATGTELVSDLDEAQGEISGELPSLKTPVQAMNELSHHFLD